MAIPATWSAYPLESQHTYNEGTGYELREIYKGPAGTAGAELALFLPNFTGYRNRIILRALPNDNGEAVCTVTFIWASNEAGERNPTVGDDYGLLNRSWTLLGSDEQLPIEAHEKVAALQHFSEDWPASIRGTVNGFQKANNAILESFPWGTPASPALNEWEPTWVHRAGAGDTLNGYAVDYASLLLLSDNPNFDRAKYVLRKTETVTSWSTMVVSHTNVNRWWRWATLTAAEPTLPSTGLLQTAGLTGYIWLKKAPEVTLASNGTRELTQEFWGGILPTTGTTARRQLEFIFGAIV